MKLTDIESFLRNNKPQVKDNPTFLLEVQQKMRAVDGIKKEVDKQRRLGHHAILIALVSGLIAGITLAVLAYLYPIDSEAVSKGLITQLRMLIDPWKGYILIAAAACAIALGVKLSYTRQSV